MALSTHPHLAIRLQKEYLYTSILGFHGCSVVNFTFFYSCLSSQNMGIEMGILVCKRMCGVSLLYLDDQ